jgi:hypothetical protein
MGLSLLAYSLLAVTGIWMFRARQTQQQRPSWLRSLHYMLGGSLVSLVLLLLAIGFVGTLGHYGTLGHSSHLVAGLIVVGLVLLSAERDSDWDKMALGATNSHLDKYYPFVGLLWVSLTGWNVVQKYLP